MRLTKLTLADLPKSLRKGIVRRLPHGNRFENLTGKKFGTWVVWGFAGFSGKFAVWLCKCECGQLAVITGGRLRAGRTGSCGCARRLSPAAKKVESLLRTIKARCYNKNDPSYHLYGARGISVCKRWRESVEAFAEDMGPQPSPKHTVARRNERGNFTPKNCYWATRGGYGRLITYNGKTQSLTSWARELGMTGQAMRQRAKRCIELGLPLSTAVSKPPKPGRPGKRRCYDGGSCEPPGGLEHLILRAGSNLPNAAHFLC
jgi:hypothetical protein